MVYVVPLYFRGFTVIRTRNSTSWYSYSCDTYCRCHRNVYSVYNMQNNTGRKFHGLSVDIEMYLVIVQVDF